MVPRRAATRRGWEPAPTGRSMGTIAATALRMRKGAEYTNMEIVWTCIRGCEAVPSNPQGELSQNIGYFCRLHPWMNAEITIVAPPNS